MASPKSLPSSSNLSRLKLQFPLWFQQQQSFLSSLSCLDVIFSLGYLESHLCLYCSEVNYGFEGSLYAESSPLLYHGFLLSGIHTFHFQPFYLSHTLSSDPSGKKDSGFFCLSSSTLCGVQPGNLLRGQTPFFHGPNASLFLPTSGHCSVPSNSSFLYFV